MKRFTLIEGCFYIAECVRSQTLGISMGFPCLTSDRACKMSLISECLFGLLPFNPKRTSSANTRQFYPVTWRILHCSGNPQQVHGHDLAWAEVLQLISLPEEKGSPFPLKPILVLDQLTIEVHTFEQIVWSRAVNPTKESNRAPMPRCRIVG